MQSLSEVPWAPCLVLLLARFLGKRLPLLFMMTKITVIGEADDSCVPSLRRLLGEMGGPDALSLSFHLSASCSAISSFLSYPVQLSWSLTTLQHHGGSPGSCPRVDNHVLSVQKQQPQRNSQINRTLKKLDEILAGSTLPARTRPLSGVHITLLPRCL